MPNIGDIVHGKEIERFPQKRYIWSACYKCGIEHWVECRKGKPFYDICFKCGRPKKKVWELITTEPYLGEIRASGQIEGYAKCKTRYIWCKCPKCGYEKWRQLGSINKYAQCRKCMHIGKIKERSGTWKGGTKINYAGYKMVRMYPSDPFYDMCNESGYVFEHRLIVAKRINRSLKAEEVVHHKDNNKSNNENSNLELLPSDTIHLTTIRMQNRINELESIIKVLTNTK